MQPTRCESISSAQPAALRQAAALFTVALCNIPFKTSSLKIQPKANIIRELRAGHFFSPALIRVAATKLVAENILEISL